MKSPLRALLACVLLALSFPILAQQQANKPDKMAAPVPIAPVPYPGLTWPYGPPNVGTGTLPTIDKASALYLPFLPWIGMNLSMLVDYQAAMYDMQKNAVDGETKPYRSENTSQANLALSHAMENNRQDLQRSLREMVQEQLTFKPENILKVNTLVNIPGTDTMLCGNGMCGTRPNDNAFNANSLLGTLAYDPKEDGENIQGLISLIGNLSMPFPSPGLSNKEAILKEQLTRPDVQDYLMRIRTASALQSMAISNLMYLAKEREVVKKLGKDAGLGPDKKHASPLEVEHDLIARRLNDPDWYASMNTASSVTLQREMLFVMVEMQRQLFQLRMTNERILATLASMQMAMPQLDRTDLQRQADEINDSLNRSDAE